jgi:8-oxo-dGTP diphosphatase
MAHIEVAVAVMLSEDSKVLTSWRQAHQHQGGLWEFPGGKREPEETMLEALKREIHEELGVEIVHAEPFVRIDHDYGDKQVSLDVWKVSQFHGQPSGREGQELRWQSVSDLQPQQFPAANEAIITALKQASL